MLGRHQQIKRTKSAVLLALSVGGSIQRKDHVIRGVDSIDIMRGEAVRRGAGGAAQRGEWSAVCNRG